MTAIYVQRGEALDYLNSTGEPIIHGDLVMIGSRVGVAGCDIAPGDVGPLHVTGVFDLPKASGEAIAMGADIYAGADNVSGAVGDGTAIGYAAADAQADAETVRVKLLG